MNLRQLRKAVPEERCESSQHLSPGSVLVESEKSPEGRLNARLMFKCQPSLRDSVFFSSLPSTSCWATLSRPGNAGTRMISDPCLGWVLARAFSLLLCTGNVEKRGFFGEKPRLLFPAIRFVVHGFDIGPAQNIFRTLIAADGIEQLGCLMVVAGGAIRMTAQPC